MVVNICYNSGLQLPISWLPRDLSVAIMRKRATWAAEMDIASYYFSSFFGLILVRISHMLMFGPAQLDETMVLGFSSSSNNSFYMDNSQ